MDVLEGPISPQLLWNLQKDAIIIDFEVIEVIYNCFQ